MLPFAIFVANYSSFVVVEAFDLQVIGVTSASVWVGRMFEHNPLATSANDFVQFVHEMRDTGASLVGNDTGPLVVQKGDRRGRESLRGAALLLYVQRRCCT